MQLDMFTPCYIQELKEEFSKVKKTSDQVRRGLFARHTALQKDFEELRQKHDEQEREIYKLKKVLYSHEDPILKVV